MVHHALVDEWVKDWWSWTNPEPYRPSSKLLNKFRDLHRPIGGFHGITGEEGW